MSDKQRYVVNLIHETIPVENEYIIGDMLKKSLEASLNKADTQGYRPLMITSLSQRLFDDRI